MTVVVYCLLPDNRSFDEECPICRFRKKKKSYQSFPDQAGGSHSFDKLTQLRLPPLAGRSFLDVGCNEGFFCGFAHQ